MCKSLSYNHSLSVNRHVTSLHVHKYPSLSLSVTALRKHVVTESCFSEEDSNISTPSIVYWTSIPVSVLIMHSIFLGALQCEDLPSLKAEIFTSDESASI